ncbi:MAG: type II toxin-antitoxin system VapC family toxin [Deltaproteobacteria bacterium]|nr:type II toxin-antitoxin system VapC family toxin [Deltaproteobacteria bacterium]MBW2017752.1 type II toxin-antitoxin system VapC family toxin [Deltaproteobacteria bacterium]
MNYILDTCIISEIVKPKPRLKVINWLRSQNENNLYISVLTLGELHKGLEKIRDKRKKKKIHLWIEQDLRERFRDKILPIDARVAMIWGQVQGRTEQSGRGMPTIDGLIAATGLAFNMVVATRNISDMEASGVALFNPWDE